MNNVKIPTLKELETAEPAFYGGHRLCAGCAEGTIVRQVLDAARYAEFDGAKTDLKDPYPVVVGVATGCLEVATTPCPYTSWGVPTLHNAFENVAATMSGVVEAYSVMRKKGRLASKKEYRFVAFAGDGGTYDIGFQSLSGALERGHKFLYVCLNNEGYMNTGIQRSSATPYGAWTTTTNAGKVEWRKNLTEIIAAHGIPYVAQAAPFSTKPRDLYEKVGRAFEAEGSAFMNILSPCSRGWRFPEGDTIKLARLAVETCYWPLFEIIEGKWTLNYKPKAKMPVVEFLSAQEKFKGVLGDKEKVAYIQNRIDQEWQTLLTKCGV
ncbi:MAG: thiamine pyrophosphate-dependent enzyme [bacterium]|nr:thiamine pyrophosphate-dependent enzyme [bacterium]